MAFSAGFAVEARHGDHLHRNSLALRLAFNRVEGVGRVLCVGDVDLLNLAASRLQELENRMATLDLLASEPLLLTTRCASWTAHLATRHRAASLTRRTALRASAWGGTGAHDNSSSSAIAVAAMPSARPNAPRPSTVVALTDTTQPTTSESSSDMAGICGASFGRSAMTVTSAETGRKPAPATRRKTSTSIVREATPENWGSSSGKCRPMSPRLAAPRSASMSAWVTTSASE